MVKLIYQNKEKYFKMNYLCPSGVSWFSNKGVHMILSNPGPLQSFYFDLSFCDPRISLKKMPSHQNSKLFRSTNSMFLGQQVHGVLLSVRGNDIRIVTL